MPNWTVGCIQREVFAEHMESQPRDPHVCSASTWQTARAFLECRGQKGIFLKSEQASGVMAHSKGRSIGKGVLEYWCQAFLPSEMNTKNLFSFCFLAGVHPGLLRGSRAYFRVQVSGIRAQRPAVGSRGWEKGGGPLAVQKTKTQGFYAHD